MKNTFLYILTVFIWGSTWLAIEFQVNEASIFVSVMYRFVIAAIVMWAFCIWQKLPMKFDWLDHGFFFLLAIGCFSLNYLFMYWAQVYLTSAMTSIAFSTLLLMNICNTRLFFGKAIEPKVYVGAVIGIAGIIALFWHDIHHHFTQTHQGLGTDMLMGLGIALSGTLVASLGNMVSVRNSKKQIGIIQGNAWGMLYGALLLFCIALLSGDSFVITGSFKYFASLGYLALFGTVIAFGSYFALLKNIGPEKASYAIVLFPVVAVVLGSFYDGFEWYGSTILGFVLVVFGNLIVLMPKNSLNIRMLGTKNRQTKTAV
jgi:drug/metabolite transporter (DMT)-like permease